MKDTMICRLCDLRCKEVVNICNGACLGAVSDVEFDTNTAKICSLIIYGKPKFFGLLGREEDFFIPWDCIECIGQDTVLVRCNDHRERITSGVFGRILGY